MRTFDQSSFPCFIIRDGTRSGDLIVWERERRGPATLPGGRLAIAFPGNKPGPSKNISPCARLGTANLASSIPLSHESRIGL
jgi:hypothetical protein